MRQCGTRVILVMLRAVGGHSSAQEDWSMCDGGEGLMQNFEGEIQR